MTAAVIVQLAQEGRLDLEDPVSKYVSGVPDGDQIIPLVRPRLGAGLLPGLPAAHLANHDQPHLFGHTQRLSRTFNATVDTPGSAT